MKRPSFKKIEQLYEKASAFVQDETVQMETHQRKSRMEKRLQHPRALAVGFLALLVLLAAVSVVTVLHERAQETTAPSETVESTDPAPDVQPVSLQGNLLFGVADSDTRTLWLLAVLSAEEDGRLTISYVTPNARVDVNNSNTTLQRHYETGGVSELLWAVGSHLQLALDRYLILTDDGLQAAVKLVGRQTLNIEEDIRYDYGGISYIIEKGEQTLSADSYCRYFSYLCDHLYQGGHENMTLALSDLGTKLLQGLAGDALQRRLNVLTRTAETSITAMDLVSYAAQLPALLEPLGGFLPEDLGYAQPPSESVEK